MKPYRNLKSQNLGFLLLLARVTVYVGILVILAAIVFFIVAYNSPFLKPMAVGGLVFIPYSTIIFFVSGLMAAIVSFEENYRLRTEFFLSGDGNN
ncbi:MAG: hypothetical protein KUG78_00330 [Kangiellaceae bacterium]|nr:hypothetical protein [Kangiellaceae bacterium]